MQPGEALGVAAQVAVTLAGFAGIVVVFRPDSVHQWTALDRFRLSLLLVNSALPLGLSMLGMLMLSVDPTPASIWRWCSGIAFVAEVAVFNLMPNSRQRLSAAEMKGVNKWLFYGIGVIVSAAVALQVINFAVWNRFWPFFATVFVHLFAALVQFLRLILLPPHRSGDA
jgi:hypothetical protein